MTYIVFTFIQTLLSKVRHRYIFSSVCLVHYRPLHLALPVRVSYWITRVHVEKSKALKKSKEPVCLRHNTHSTKQQEVKDQRLKGQARCHQNLATVPQKKLMTMTKTTSTTVSTNAQGALGCLKERGENNWIFTFKCRELKV